jgi:hypothetical protein
MILRQSIHPQHDSVRRKTGKRTDEQKSDPQQRERKTQEQTTRSHNINQPLLKTPFWIFSIRRFFIVGLCRIVNCVLG